MYCIEIIKSFMINDKFYVLVYFITYKIYGDNFSNLNVNSI